MTCVARAVVAQVLERVYPRVVPVVPEEAQGVAPDRLDPVQLKDLLVHLELRRRLRRGIAVGVRTRGARTAIAQELQREVAVVPVFPVDLDAGRKGDLNVL